MPKFLLLQITWGEIQFKNLHVQYTVIDWKLAHCAVDNSLKVLGTSLVLLLDNMEKCFCTQWKKCKTKTKQKTFCPKMSYNTIQKTKKFIVKFIGSNFTTYYFYFFQLNSCFSCYEIISRGWRGQTYNEFLLLPFYCFKKLF